MKLLVRYLLVFAIPLLASLLLFYASYPLRLEAHQTSSDWLRLMVSSELRDKSSAFAALRNDDHARIFSRIEHLAIFTVLLASLLCALIIPPFSSSERKLNLLTAMVVALCAAKLVVGFRFLNWLDFGKATVAGSVLAVSVVWLRSTFVDRPADTDDGFVPHTRLDLPLSDILGADRRERQKRVRTDERSSRC